MADKALIGEIAVRIDRAIERCVDEFLRNCDFYGETPEEVQKNKDEHAKIMRGNLLTGMSIATNAFMSGDGAMTPSIMDEAIRAVARSHRFETEPITTKR